MKRNHVGPSARLPSIVPWRDLSFRWLLQRFFALRFRGDVWQFFLRNRRLLIAANKLKHHRGLYMRHNVMMLDTAQANWIFSNFKLAIR
jgi:hypothetical protein